MPSINICRVKAGQDRFGGRWEDQDGESFERRGASRSYIAVAEGYSSPTDVGPADIKASAGIPVPGVSIYVSESGRVYPYCLCRNVSVTRRPDQSFVFDVDVEYEEPDSGGEDTDTPPADPESLSPVISTALTTHQVTLWNDQVNNSKYLLPNGMLYSMPLTGAVSGLKFEVTQYENSFDAQNLVGRSHVVNDQAKTINGIQYAAGSLMVTDVKWDKNVKWFPDPSDENVFVLTNRVKYTVEWKEYTVESLNDLGNVVSLTCHWGSVAINSSSHFLTAAGNIGTRRLISNDLFQQYGSAYIKSDGTMHPVNVQGGVPPQQFFNSQKNSSFNFLRT